MKVLYVEDLAEVRRAVARVLQKRGIIVSTASCGEDAVVMLEALSFDVIVLDHHMPGLHGAPLVAAVRALAPGVPIVALTGLPSDAWPSGYDAIVAKPLDSIDDLLAAIRKVLGGPP